MVLDRHRGLINGDGLLKIGPEYLFIWVGVVFLSILVHELGHAVAYRRFGADADIVLYAFGGLAVGTHVIAGRGRRIVVSLAGPVAGFVLFGLVYGTNQAFEWGQSADGRAPNGKELFFLYRQLIWVNLIWGLFNLLPVFPLDGGQATRELCGMKWGSRGKRISLQISFVTALLMVAYSLLCEIDSGKFGAGVMAQLPWWLRLGSVFTAILFGVLAYESYRLLQRIEWTDGHWNDRLPWEK